VAEWGTRWAGVSRAHLVTHFHQALVEQLACDLSRSGTTFVVSQRFRQFAKKPPVGVVERYLLPSANAGGQPFVQVVEVSTRQLLEEPRTLGPRPELEGEPLSAGSKYEHGYEH